MDKVNVNRRIPIGTYGGVGGRGASAPLLPDYLIATDLSVVAAIERLGER